MDIIRDLGGPASVARLLNIKPPSVISWKGCIPMDRRVELERKAYPKFTVEMAGDDMLWQRVPDACWPHPGGRPCVDVAAMQARDRGEGVPPAAGGNRSSEDRRKAARPIAFGDRRAGTDRREPAHA